MIGDNIKRLRQERGWSQMELATRMGYSHHSSIGKIEANINNVTQSTIVKFADCFGVSIQDILGDDFLARDYTVKDANIRYLVELTSKMSEKDKMNLVKYAQFLVGDYDA